jgi:hypothetical protein
MKYTKTTKQTQTSDTGLIFFVTNTCLYLLEA